MSFCSKTQLQRWKFIAPLVPPAPPDPPPSPSWLWPCRRASWSPLLRPEISMGNASGNPWDFSEKDVNNFNWKNWSSNGKIWEIHEKNGLAVWGHIWHESHQKLRFKHRGASISSKSCCGEQLRVQKSLQSVQRMIHLDTFGRLEAMLWTVFFQSLGAMASNRSIPTLPALPLKIKTRNLFRTWLKHPGTKKSNYHPVSHGKCIHLSLATESCHCILCGSRLPWTIPSTKHAK